MENYLYSYAQFDYAIAGWRFNLLADGFRRSDPNAIDTEQPYNKLPSLSVSKSAFSHFGQWNMTSNFTHFNAKDTDTTRSDGKRFDTLLRWDFPLLSPGIQLTPSIQLRHTHYSVDPLSPTEQKKTIRRTIPSFSLRGKMIFEKTRKGYKRTLERKFII